MEHFSARCISMGSNSAANAPGCLLVRFVRDFSYFIVDFDIPLSFYSLLHLSC